MSEVISREILSLGVILLITTYSNIRSDYPVQQIIVKDNGKLLTDYKLI